MGGAIVINKNVDGSLPANKFGEGVSAMCARAPVKPTPFTMPPLIEFRRVVCLLAVENNTATTAERPSRRARTGARRPSGR